MNTCVAVMIPVAVLSTAFLPAQTYEYDLLEAWLADHGLAAADLGLNPDRDGWDNTKWGLTADSII